MRVVIAIVVACAGALVATNASASPGDEYTGTNFGIGQLPSGCENDTFSGTDNACYHMRTGMNGLDSPEVDVLLLVPASPWAARDMRIMREAVEMWRGGIRYLAPQMGMPWMRNIHFHISTDIERATDGVVTYPIVDPEIVVVATNPDGVLGIGIDPYATAAPMVGVSKEFPCHGITNPFDAATWASLPGFNHHGDERGGTVTEDCGGAGGNTCFAVNTADDAPPSDPDGFNLFDLVAHEFGHCLTIGHVGDGAEGPWSRVPTNDIMSYNGDPPDLFKCVSTVDLEGVAVTQSHYLDTNGDGQVNARDHLDANEKHWDDSTDHFQVQHPRDHFYASSTGNALDCPQPDVGVNKGKEPNWEPAPKPTSRNELTITSPRDGGRAADGVVHVRGSVAHVRTDRPPAAVKSPSAAPLRTTTETVEFHRKGGNHFDATESTLGVIVRPDNTLPFDVRQTSDIAFTLAFKSPTGHSDLDLRVFGDDYDSGSEGATSANPEHVRMGGFAGKLTVAIDPYLVGDPSGADFTLRAVLSPPKSAQPQVHTSSPRPVREHVRVYVDDNTVWAAHADVDTIDGPANFDIGMFVPRGTHTLRVEWDRCGKVVATQSRRVTA